MQVAENGESRTTLMTVDEVAKWLAVSKGWVHDHAGGRRRPVLPHVKLGKSVRFRVQDVEAFITECVRLEADHRRTA